MRNRLLGRSGLRVPEPRLGTMTFGEGWGWGASKEVSRQNFDAFAAAGGALTGEFNQPAGPGEPTRVRRASEMSA